MISFYAAILSLFVGCVLDGIAMHAAVAMVRAGPSGTFRFGTIVLEGLILLPMHIDLLTRILH